MSYDLFISHRGYNEICHWWSRNGKVDNNDELIMQRAYSGTFYAKEVSAEQYSTNTVGGSFRMDKTDVVLRSPDNLSGIRADDIVSYQGDRWRVLTVQKEHARVGSIEFSNEKNISHFWVVNLTTL